AIVGPGVGRRRKIMSGSHAKASRMSAAPPPAAFRLDHEHHLRRAFEVARRARANGNHPFGAILVDAAGQLLVEWEQGYRPARDRPAQRERLLASRACGPYEPRILAACTIYASAEPCAMCAGAIYWSGIGRVVFGLSERRLRALTGNHAENPTL